MVIFFGVKGQEASKKPDFKPGFKLNAQVFGDYFYKFAADSAKRGNTQYAKAPADFNAFAIRRVYLGAEYNISERLMAETVLAMEPQADTPGASGRTLFIKYANLRWKNIYKGADLVIGQMSTPTFSLLSEKTWGYRPVEKSLLDQRKIASSSDLGISLQAKFGAKQQFGYNLMLGNNNSTNQENDKSKKGYASVYGRFIKKQLLVELYSDYESIRKTGYAMSKMTPKVHVAWQKLDSSENPVFVIGVEAFQQMITNPTASGTKAAPMGVSGFVRGTLKKDALNAFARYDFFDPDGEKKTSGSIEEFITLGLDFMPMKNKNFHLIPNFWYNGYANKNDAATGKNAVDRDTVGRITFFYVFK
jgi:hypothetical protein